MNHATGPWVVRETQDDELYEVYREEGGELIAFAADTADQRANARLIAAAPELLEVLREVALGCERRLRKGKDQADLETLRLCRSAITKAEGRD
jgi:hypothetical protein